MKNLNASKAHGWDKFSIGMIKLCGKTITIPLKLIFRSMLEEVVFQDDWKKSNVIPIHKRNSKNLMKNYRPIFNYFLQNELFTDCEPSFIPRDACVAQLLSIMH